MLDPPGQVGFSAKGNASLGEWRKAAKKIDRRWVHGRDHVLDQQAIRAEAQVHKLRAVAIARKHRRQNGPEADLVDIR